MKILFISMYSPPEKTGIGKYNGEMVDYMARNGHDIYYLTTMPFYPEWRVADKYKGKFTTSENFDGSRIRRIFSYTPKNVSSIKRIVKEIQFYINCLLTMILKSMSGYKPDIVMFVAPPFFIPILAKFLFPKSKTVYHIQDLEIDAAIELNMLPEALNRVLLKTEKRILESADMVSTISEGMIRKVLSKGIERPIVLFPNWSSLSSVETNNAADWLHKHLALPTEKKLIVYSGNIGKKQGFEILPSVISNICTKHNNAHFVILGSGVYKQELIKMLEDVNKSHFTIGDLVESSDLKSMLCSSYIQLVIQKSQGSDSFMPSKLTNILAAGVPSVVTAKEGTGLHKVITDTDTAIVCDDNASSLTHSIDALLTDTDKRSKLKQSALHYAKTHLSSHGILSAFEKKMLELVNQSPERT